MFAALLCHRNGGRWMHLPQPLCCLIFSVSAFKRPSWLSLKAACFREGSLCGGMAVSRHRLASLRMAENWDVDVAETWTRPQRRPHGHTSSQLGHPRPVAAPSSLCRGFSSASGLLCLPVWGSATQSGPSLPFLGGADQLSMGAQASCTWEVVWRGVCVWGASVPSVEAVPPEGRRPCSKGVCLRLAGHFP